MKAALAYRDFMVSNYSDAAQAKWLSDRSIDLLRGTGRLAGMGVVEVDGVRHTRGTLSSRTGQIPSFPPSRDSPAWRGSGATARRPA